MQLIKYLPFQFQANYSSAKLGLVGLSSTLSQEGAKYNIHSNVIVPMAASRMTKGIIPDEMFDQLSPDHIAPVVAWMCHEECQVSAVEKAKQSNLFLCHF